MTFDNRDRNASPPPPPPSAKRRRWIMYALAGLGVLLLLLLLSRCGRDDDIGETVEVPPAEPVPATSTMTAPAGAAGGMAPGAVATAPVGLSQLDAYLAGTDAAPRTFAFERLHFDTGSSQIRAQDRAEITTLAAALTRQANARVRVVGYADARGAAPANAQLAQARADVVRSALIAAGVDGRRIEAASGGEANPADTNATAAGMAENRRTELVVLQR